MKKVWKLFPIFFLLVLLFTGCTPKENKGDETQEQSGAPMIDYEVPDKVKDYDFNYGTADDCPQRGRHPQDFSGTL